MVLRGAGLYAAVLGRLWVLTQVNTAGVDTLYFIGWDITQLMLGILAGARALFNLFTETTPYTGSLPTNCLAVRT